MICYYEDIGIEKSKSLRRSKVIAREFLLLSSELSWIRATDEN